MDSAESSIKTWLKFFMDASIPAGIATEYAISFSDNRMRLDMLPELTKDYLRDLNITVLGDVIAILKHAKSVSHQEYKARKIDSSGGLSPSPSPPPPATPVLKKSVGTSASAESPASRMVKRLVRKESAPAPPTATGRLKRAADGLPEGCTGGKKTVFDRLGGGAESQVSSTTPDSSPRFTITGLTGPAPAQASPASAAGRHRVMFVSDASGESPASRMVKRLVRREPDSIQTPSPLPARPGGLSYRGVLKSGAATPEKPAATGVKMKAGIVTGTLASDREAAPVSARSRVGHAATSRSRTAAVATARGVARGTARGKSASPGVKSRLSRPTAAGSAAGPAGGAAGGVKARLGGGAGSVRSRLGTSTR